MMCEFNMEYIAYIKMQVTHKRDSVSSTETNPTHTNPQPETKKPQFNNDEGMPTTK